MSVLRRLRGLFQRGQIHRDLQQEMLTHIELRTQQYLDRGFSTEEAQRLARRQFGNRTAQLESAGEAWAFRRLEAVMQDVRYGARALRRSPAFALTGILLLALGIGATSAVFSVVDRLLFRSLPYPDSERLFSIGILHPILDGEFLIANDYLFLRERNSTLVDLTSWTGAADCDLTEQRPLRLTCAQVEASFLPVFGVKPILGRNFTDAEDVPEARKVALISYGLWQSRFAGNPKALGQTVSLDGTTTEIVGVLPRDFELPTLQRADVLVPQALKIRQYRRGESGRPLRVFGRFRSGTSIVQARAVLQAGMQQVMAGVPLARNARVILRSLRDFQIQDVKLASWALFATTLAILLIVCANVANLLLARAAERRKEFAMRLALGAGRARLICHSLAENLLLTGAGAIGGVALARLLVRVFQSIAPPGVPRMQDATVDSRVLAFALLLALACGVMLGLLPALASLQQGVLSRRGAGRVGYGTRRALTVAQIALSLILLSNAGLLLDGLRRITRITPGMTAEQVVTAGITVNPARYPNAARRQQFFDDLTSRLRSNPLVSHAAVSDTLPPYGFIHNRPLSVLQLASRAPLPMGAGGMVSWRSVSPGYFATMGIPIMRGRDFTEEDRTSREQTIVVSASLARRLFGEGEAIGQVLHFQPSGPDATVIGVAADIDNTGTPGRSDPEYYVVRKKITDPRAGADASLITRSLHQYDGEAFVLVRSAARTGAVADWIRTEAAALDPTIPVTIATMRQRVDAVSERPRFNAMLMSLFALTGVLLAASGLYGLVAFLTAQRTQEIGVRVALGATPARIAGLVARDALHWTVAGVAVGVTGAALTARAMRGLLPGTGAGAPMFIGGAALLLVLVALAAAALPSLRASRLDPVKALRAE
jgi:putative ABC transport system permease protein